MVEQGIVKVFFGGRSRSKSRFGFIRLLDAQGNLTGEEVFFHLKGARKVIGGCFRGCNPFVSWSDKATVTDLGREPRKGDRVVMELPKFWDKPGLRKVTWWTFKSIWDAQEHAASTNILNPDVGETDLSWRIVLKGYRYTGIIRFAGTVDETGAEDLLEVVLNGTRMGTMKSAKRWKATDLNFDDFCRGDEQGYDSYNYYLQIRQPNGKWRTVKGVDPVAVSDDCEDSGGEDDYVSTNEVYGRAYAHFGNAEMAREATEMYPGDFM